MSMRNSRTGPRVPGASASVGDAPGAGTARAGGYDLARCAVTEEPAEGVSYPPA